ncbi:homoserine O-succinyltransferase [Clostridium botulinum]|uniref:Homoserine O-acetyltransferase n=2 Tax=Clostridium botulinum TaxID=1491 RepID=A0A846I0I0_CLOBO|nr:homoserine O-succinyltransferase [Clostridium botulinum]AJD27525.1 homoserine O-succinyltransferase [Clostridium botulinum CDC_297]ACQ52420.1 homoserine O-succinyltransferase [Clostridium botulinum Ba4 str. 657]AJE10192.1 homoserine O-succinyltransferase [Clostridium botulinum CDC_1436]APR00811.1 homoserine O-succinyltransferase [Clostridium botulinum]APU60773.1 homoserine O-succinyltransferase [Clostridium botulinum]
MALIIDKNLPAYQILKSENINIMDKLNYNKNTNKLKLIILNLMPKKIEAETQILRVLGKSFIDLEITFLKIESYKSKNISNDHLNKFYKNFSEIKNYNFHGMIITGAPVELMDFERVDYWEELKNIMDYCNKKVKSTIFICWAAQAALYYYYDINKYSLNKKLFGVFSHKIIKEDSLLTKGFDDEFYVPHSRYTYTKKEDIKKCKEIEIISESKEAGLYLMQSNNFKKIFISGHCEYDRYTLYEEYIRDINKNKPIDIPKNYFKENNLNKKPIMKWRCHGETLFLNWIQLLEKLSSDS